MAGCAPRRVWPGTGLTDIRQTSPAAAAAHGRRHCGRGRHVYDARHEARGGVCAAHVVRKVVLLRRPDSSPTGGGYGRPAGRVSPSLLRGASTDASEYGRWRLRTPASMADGVCGRRRSLAGYPAVGAYRIRPLRRTRRGRMWNMYSPPMVALGGRMRYAPTLPAGEASQVPGKSFPASAEAASLISHPPRKCALRAYLSALRAYISALRAHFLVCPLAAPTPLPPNNEPTNN